MQPTNTLHLALNFEQNYLIPFYTFLASVFKNNKKNKFLFHIISSGLTEQEKASVIAYVAQQGSELRFYAVADDFAAGFVNHGFSRATFYRLLFVDLLPAEVEKFLYIDVDIVVVGDLAQLYNIDMQGFPVAAVPEPVLRIRPELGITAGMPSFNAGVLLIDRVKWRAQKISEKALDFLRDNHEIAVFADQDALNATLINNWLHLEPKFNLMRDYLPRELRKKDVADFLKDKVVVHYAQFYKPWHTLCTNKLRFLYHEYAKLAPVTEKKPFIDFKPSPKMLWGLLKINARELYYDYPVIPVALVDSLRKLKN